MDDISFRVLSKQNKKVVLLCLSLIMLFTLVSCAKKEYRIPSVRYENNEIYVDGKYIASSETFNVSRIDGHVVSLICDSGFINLDAEGNEISLRDVIKNRRRYESSISDKIRKIRIGPITSDSVQDYKFDYDEMLAATSDYDEAMKLPFFFTEDAVSIIYTDKNGYSSSVSFSFKEDRLNPAYASTGEITCGRWMIGRLGYSIKGLVPDGYKDHWVLSSLEIKNYEGETYYWFCVSYTDEEDNKTYYSVIVRKDEGEETIVSSEPVDGPFYCCDIDAFYSQI